MQGDMKDRCVEDDPHYFPQFGEYLPKHKRSDSAQSDGRNRFISSLSPGFLKFDGEGRSLSKVWLLILS
ncbi:hypothetical protein BKA82DRAFT_4105335 [Pisolithus tinctorius]|nr:hypothetical protein BKA82DRAFT_4105335 [Pisolithus tinctorius]